MRVKRYDRDVKDDNGSKELVDLRNRNKFLLYVCQSGIFVRGKVFVRITVHYPAPGHYFNNSNSERSSRRIQR